MLTRKFNQELHFFEINKKNILVIDKYNAL